MPAKKRAKKSNYTKSFVPVKSKDVKIHPREVAGQEVLLAGAMIVAVGLFAVVYKMYY